MSDIRILRFLQSLQLFEGFSVDQLQTMGSLLQLQLVPPRGHLFKEGDAGDEFFFVMEGEVGVFKQIPGADLERLTTLGPRAMVGQLCLIDGQPRSATCTAITRTLVLRGERRLFDRLFTQGDPLAFRFIDVITRELCQHLRATNQHLYDLYDHPEQTSIRLRAVAHQIARSMGRESEQIEVVKQTHREHIPRRTGLSGFLR